MCNAVFDVKNVAALKESYNALFPIWEEVAKARANREVYDTRGVEEKLDELVYKLIFLSVCRKTYCDTWHFGVQGEVPEVHFAVKRDIYMLAILIEKEYSIISDQEPVEIDSEYIHKGPISWIRVEGF